MFQWSEQRNSILDVRLFTDLLKKTSFRSITADEEVHIFDMG